MSRKCIRENGAIQGVYLDKGVLYPFLQVYMKSVFWETWPSKKSVLEFFWKINFFFSSFLDKVVL